MKTSSVMVSYLFFRSTDRSSRPEVFCKKAVIRNFAKFTGKHLCQSLLFIKNCRHKASASNFIKKETLAQVFFCEFCEISRNNFCYRIPPVAVSAQKQALTQLNLFNATDLFLYPLEIFKNLWFSDVFKGYWKRPVVMKLIYCLKIKLWLLPLRPPIVTQRVFHVETTWKQLFPRRFNVEYTWCVCRV